MRWASAVDTDNSLRAAVEHAAETVFLGLGRQEPDLAIVFVSAEHAAHFDAIPALLQREFMQGRRMVIDQVNVWVGAVLSVSLVLTGMGAMSLAIGRLAGAVLSGVLFLKFSPLPLRFGFDRSRARRRR